MKFEQEYVRCVRNEEECVCSHCNILITGKIIKEMPGSVASGTHCSSRQIMGAKVTVDTVSRYCVLS